MGGAVCIKQTGSMDDIRRDEYVACKMADVLRFEIGVHVREYPQQDSTL